MITVTFEKQFESTAAKAKAQVAFCRSGTCMCDVISLLCDLIRCEVSGAVDSVKKGKNNLFEGA